MEWRMKNRDYENEQNSIWTKDVEWKKAVEWEIPTNWTDGKMLLVLFVVQILGTHIVQK